MSAETYTYHFVHWPSSGLENFENEPSALQGNIQGELDQQALLTGALPMVTNGDLDPWIIDHFGWDEELASKSDVAYQQYVPAWEHSFHGHYQHDSIHAR